MRCAALATIALLAAVHPLLSAAEIPSREVAVRDGDRVLTGRLWNPAEAPGPGIMALRPAVLVVHEWWGRNAYADRRARELAEAGWVALAVDLYGEPASSDFAEAVARSGPFYREPALFVRRLALFREALLATRGVDPDKLAAVGFCFGGSAVLQAARSGMELRGVVAFHPGLKTAQPATAAPRARILVCHGGADPFVPPADVAAFIQEMTAAQADWRMEVYGRAVHAFTNPEAGRGIANVPPEVPFAQAVAYDAAAEAAAMQAMRSFLAEAVRN